MEGRRGSVWRGRVCGGVEGERVWRGGGECVRCLQFRNGEFLPKVFSQKPCRLGIRRHRCHRYW